MSTDGKNVFLLGPGYIGRTVIDELLKDGYNITTMIRRPEAATELENIGVKTIAGDLSKNDIITKQVEASDIVFHTATADDLPSVEAILAGISKRAAQDEETIYIHTSGTSFLSDESKSAYTSDVVYSDNKPEGLDARPDSSSHRGIDLAILRARKQIGTKAKIFIMLPPLIYGCIEAHGRLSIQVITMTRFALKHKYAGHVGQGKAVWSTIHVADLARAYVTILHWAEKAPCEASLGNPYFFCENGEEISWGDIAAMIGQSLHSNERIPDAEPREISENQWDDLFGPYSSVVIGSNSRSRAERLRELGWQPRERKIRVAFEKEELPLLLAEKGEFHGYRSLLLLGRLNELITLSVESCLKQIHSADHAV
jgi:nucleoside-diphosphate-sugar epimerase